MTQFANSPDDNLFLHRDHDENQSFPHGTNLEAISGFQTEPGMDMAYYDMPADMLARDTGPSLPIILLGAACGLGSGMVVFYITYGLLRWSEAVSAGLATLALLTAIGAVSGGLSVLGHSQAGWVNVGFSCGVVILCLLFFTLCVVVGAVVATLILMIGG